ncbi:CDP-diacylglycerol--glycerol-3-phosphate 3-phosphatidyltransferase [Planctomycetota bacterium]
MRILTVPNLLTLLRLAVLPVIIALYQKEAWVWSGTLFAIIMMTDILDGWLARKLDQRTRLGLYLDPVSDKIIICVLFYVLAHGGIVPFWMAHLFLAREFAQNGIRAAAGKSGTVVGSNWMGKVKAFLQIVVITTGLVAPGMTNSCPWMPMLVLWAAGLVLLLSWLFLVRFIFLNRSLLAEE